MGGETPRSDVVGDAVVSHYDEAYYNRDIAETWFSRQGLLRPDQLAAVCYIYGKPFYGDETYPVRSPEFVLSLGCGLGQLESFLEGSGLVVLGVDTSTAAAASYLGSYFWQLSALTALQRAVSSDDPPDTILFCESIEHIPADELHLCFDFLRGTTHPLRVVIVNWPARHPILPDDTGWDHITRVDDALFDQLSSGFITVVRRGSHLVLDR